MRDLLFFLWLFLFDFLRIFQSQNADDEQDAHDDHRNPHEIHQIALALEVQSKISGQKFEHTGEAQDAFGIEGDPEKAGNDIDARNDLDRKTMKRCFKVGIWQNLHDNRIVVKLISHRKIHDNGHDQFQNRYDFCNLFVHMSYFNRKSLPDKGRWDRHCIVWWTCMDVPACF